MGFEIARLLLAATLAVTVAACDAADKGKPVPPQASPAAAMAPVNSIDRSHAGTPAPAVVFEARGGGKTSVADLARAAGGQRVLVNLWATWCAPCIAEMPELDTLARRQQGKLLVLPLSQDMEGWPAVDGFFKPGRFRTLVPMLDQPGSFAERLGARGLPMSVLYDAQGREVWRVAGTLQWGSPEVAKVL
jgi:thiol-disulfide isomerase/thioredoxin